MFSPFWKTDWPILIAISLLWSVAAVETVIAQERPKSDLLPPGCLWQIDDAGQSTVNQGINRLEFSNDGKMLAVRDRDNSVSLYDAGNQQKLISVSGHDNNWIETIDFSPDGRSLITAAGSGETVKIWNTRNGSPVLEIETDATAAYFSRDGDRIHLLGRKNVEEYSWPGGQTLGLKRWNSDNDNAVAMSRDGNQVVKYRSLNPQVFQTQLIDLENKSTMELPGNHSIPQAAVISPDNLWVAAIYHRESKIYLWDLRDPQNSRFILNKHRDRVLALTFSADSRWLISGSGDETVVVWDLLTRQSIGQFSGHTEQVKAVACSPSDHLFVSGSSGKSDSSVLGWNMKSALFPPIKRQRSSFDQIWNGMGASLANSSLTATHGLIANAQQYLPELRRRVFADTTAADSDQSADLISQLNDEDWAVRENAMLRLMAVRSQVESELRRMVDQTLTTEVRYRIRKILNQSEGRTPVNIVEQRRWQRIIWALEEMNTEDSNSLLSRIAYGHADLDIASAAKSSLQRNEQRTATTAK